MEIGNQIKSLRIRKGVTQEEMARHFGITSQAVSKWERGAATPDIGLLPDISAYFGVTIDELFALSDDTRMERIQNMIWDVRDISWDEFQQARSFLLSKAAKEPKNGQPHALLAELENHFAQFYRDQAAEHAMEALMRDHTIKGAHSELTASMCRSCGDWCASNHFALIEYYKEFVEKHPDYAPGYLWLLSPLIEDGRFREADEYCARLERIDDTYRPQLFKSHNLIAQGKWNEAQDILREMECRHSDAWIMYLGIGDCMVRMGKYDEAKVYYRKYMQHQTPPRYTDSLTSIAQLCEIQGDYAGAIEAIRQEIELLAGDWNTLTGETVDQHTRNIERLQNKIRISQNG